MVVFAKAFPTSKVGFPMRFVEACDDIDTTVFE
jgi:hypothetical protein